MPKPKPPAPPTKSSIGARMRAAREAAGLTQVELAARLGVRQAQVSLYESGAREPGAVLLWRWAQAIGCDVGALVG